MAKGIRKWTTAAELMAELNSDPEYIERKKQRDEKWRRIDAELARAEAHLVEDLCSHGFEVESVYDLVNRSEPYPEAIPVLLAHLDRKYPERITEGIIRALTVPDAAGVATEKIVEVFKKDPSTSSVGLKWVAGNSLTEALTEEYVEEVVELVRDPSNGEARSMLPFALIRFRNSRPEVERVLKELINDPQIGWQAAKALRGESPVDKD